MPDIKAQNQTALASVKAIYDAAEEANTLLDGMQTAAEQAGTTLTQIYADAENAQASADVARSSAANALTQLSVVESVVGVLNLLSKHGTYVLTTDEDVETDKWYFTRSGYAGGSYSGSIATFETTAGDNIESLEISLEPIQAGSGTPSPTNIRPISGRTEVVTSVVGKNLIPFPFRDGDRTRSGITWTTNSDGTLNAHGTASSTIYYAMYGANATSLDILVPLASLGLQGGDTVTLSSNYSHFVVVQCNKDDGTLVNTGLVLDGGGSITKTLPTTAKYVYIGLRVLNGETVNQDNIFVQLEKGSTATAYEPYNGTTYTTTLGRTVYGGTVDVVSGVLTVDRAMITLNGSETWAASNGTATACMRVQTRTSVGFKPNTSNASLVGDISSAFVEATPNQTWDGTIGFSVSTDANPYLHFCQTGQKNMSVEAWKTYLASNPIQVVGLLATPQTYQLTPQRVATLLSVNNLWASSGNVSVTVRSTYSYSVVNNPTGVPHAQGWYELIGIDEAVTNYVSSHLALTDDGLSLQQDGSDYRILISTDGLKIIGANGATVASYGTDTIIGNQTGFHVKIDGTELGFYQGAQRVAYINNNQLYITQSVVLRQMDLGTPVASGGLGQWSWKVHPNGQNPRRNNLNLKWIG